MEFGYSSLFRIQDFINTDSKNSSTNKHADPELRTDDDTICYTYTVHMLYVLHNKILHRNLS